MKKRIAVIIILVIILAGAVILICTLRGNSKRNPSAGEETAISAGEGIACVYYADTYLSLDKNGIVCSNSSGRPVGIPEVSGVEFTKLTYGKPAQVQEKTALEYVLRVASDLSKQGIRADRIAYENRMVTVYTGLLEIQLGKNEKTDDKISDLSDFIDKLDGQSGTLFMQNGNANNYGYTFRSN